MKKIITILLLILGITYITTLTTYAQTTNFYEGEYINGIWMTRYNKNTKIKYYQKARFFRERNTNEFAYCVEPFSFFNDNSEYLSTNSPYNLTQEQINRISLIAHFGYNYKGHTDLKWYAVTQLMIWQASDSTGDYYFTDSLNGNRVNYYDNEINEINNLINNYNTNPSIINNTYYSVYNKELVIEDTNNILNNYSVDNYSKIENNKLIVNNLEPGEYTINLNRKDNYYNKPILFYQSNTSQNLVETGNINELNYSLKIIIQNTSIKINKLDKDTKSTTSSGEAQLDNAIYGLYNENNELIDKLTIKDNTSSLSNLDYGKYYIKELEAGEGYLLDEEIHEFEITKDNPNIELTLYNEVIKSNVIINKQYEKNTNNYEPEENIVFEIYDNNNNLVSTKTTNNEGNINIELPYGKYTLIQINTTSGYNKVDPLDFIIDSTEDKNINLKDLKILVPNTHTEKINIFKLIILFFTICI